MRVQGSPAHARDLRPVRARAHVSFDLDAHVQCKLTHAYANARANALHVHAPSSTKCKTHFINQLASWTEAGNSLSPRLCVPRSKLAWNSLRLDEMTKKDLTYPCKHKTFLFVWVSLGRGFLHAAPCVYSYSEYM